MKLSISNIGWSAGQDKDVYALMKKYGFTGLEIAPTRVFPKQPYEALSEAAAWSAGLTEKYGFCVPSMQSIWFGRQEKLFGTDAEKSILADYTKKAVDFAAAVGCWNLVFGCPRNRAVPEGVNMESGIRFFKEIGDYAAGKGTAVGMEANPPVYHTNYINDTRAALDLIRQVDSKGFLLNLDVGTMIENNEDAAGLEGSVGLVNHVHISEPGLKPIESREIHRRLSQILAEGSYQGFVSVEMGKVDDISVIEDTMRYVRSVFG